MCLDHSVDLEKGLELPGIARKPLHIQLVRARELVRLICHLFTIDVVYLYPPEHRRQLFGLLLNTLEKFRRGFERYLVYGMHLFDMRLGKLHISLN